MRFWRKSWSWAKFLIVTLFLALIFTVFLYSYTTYLCSNSLSVVRYHPYDPDAITCYRATGKINWTQFDKLLNKDKSDKKIYFLSTSCKGGLDSRESCAVESAARAHPDWDVIVFYLGELHKEFLNSTTFGTLKQLRNIQLSKVIFSTHMDSKAFDPIINSTLGSKTKASLLSDWLRFIILKKYGGVFLDLDMIITNSFEKFPDNWVASQSVSELGAGAIRLSNDKLGREVVALCCKNFYKQVYPTLNVDKEAVITDALQQICFTKSVTIMKAEFCQGFGILESYNFYPMNSRNWFYYLRPSADLSMLDTYFAYGHKTWSSMSLGTIYGPYSKLALLAQKYCPAIYKEYGLEFGL